MPTSGKGDPETIGRDLFASLLERHTDDLWSWLADVAEMSPDELDKQPMTAPGEIIEQVLEDEDIGPFAKQLRTLLQKAQTPAGTSSQPATAGQTKQSTH